MPEDSKISPPRTKTEMLAVLRDFFVHSNQAECEDVWAILTALRGPDKDDTSLLGQEMKESTTSIVRQAVLGPLRFTAAYAGIVRNDMPLYVTIRKRFIWHAWQAFKALGLKWNQLNEGMS